MGRATGRWAWTAMLLLAVSAVAPGDDALAGGPDLVVSWSDPQRALPGVQRDELAREVEALFSGWGVDLETAPEDAVAGSSATIRVVLLDCTRLGNAPPRVMGQTSTVPREVPAVWILVPNVRQVLDAAERGAPGSVLARALARVAAHEILHVLAPGLGHASSGLMRSHLRASELSRPWIPIDDEFRRALLAAVRPHTQPIDS